MSIGRPIAAMWPTVKGVSIVLDVGASIGADAQHLVDLSIMGAAMARIVRGIDRPSVGLLNVGVEEIKGLEEIKAAGRLLRELALPSLDYRGFVEGDDLGRGTVDVVVTEGFTGNIALKTAEGTAVQIGRYLREVMSADLMSKIGYWFARGAFAALREKMDPRGVNGGVFLGLDGVVIKSHGGTDAVGYARAIGVGHEMVSHDLLARIRDQLALSQERSVGRGRGCQRPAGGGGRPGPLRLASSAIAAGADSAHRGAPRVRRQRPAGCGRVWPRSGPAQDGPAAHGAAPALSGMKRPRGGIERLAFRGARRRRLPA